MKSKNKASLRIVHKFYSNVESVRDANSDLIVEVTQKDSDMAKKKDHKDCAMAVVCKKKQKADGVIISLRSAYIIKGTEAVRYRVPESTAREVVSFDRKGGFEPGKYKLKAPRGTERLGSKQTGATKNKSGRTLSPFRHLTENVRTSLLA